MKHFLALTCVSAAATASAQPLSLKTATEAISRADALTRLQKISGAPTAAIVKVSKDVTPFLGERNSGKPAWRIQYPRSSLKFDSAQPDAADRYRRTFLVMLDTVSGRLLFITSTYDGPRDPDLRSMPSSGAAARQLRDEGEVYAGYPDQDPKIDFLAALERIQRDGTGSPLLAKQIHGVYVLDSQAGSQPKPVWAITLRGLPPLAAHGRGAGSVPVWQRNHVRNVVDAVTGRLLFASNSPQPQ